MSYRLPVLSLLLCLAVPLAGCQQKKGFEPSDVHYSQMGIDAAYRLNGSYLPAKTVFAFSGDDANGVFNSALAGKLREMGYAVNEGPGADGMLLKARLLRVGERQFIVLMDVGESQLQRGFDLMDSDISPNSYWMARFNDAEGEEYSVRR